MDSKEALNFIFNSLDQEHKEGNGFSDYENTVDYKIRDVKHRVNSFKNMSINRNSIEVIFYKDIPGDDSQWDGNDNTYAIFKYDEGLCLVTYNHWWAPPFSGNNWVFEICLTHDWETFSNICLTNDERMDVSDYWDKLIDNILLKGE